MADDTQMTPPAVIWAQRRNTVFLTVCLEDCKDPEIKIESDKLYFKGIGGSEKKPHELTINFCKEIKPEQSSHFVRDRIIEFILAKKDDGPYWPQLTKEKVKHHWLKIDFNKWKDENESDEEDVDGRGASSIDEMLRTMGGLGEGGDFEKPSLGDLRDESDSDDGDLPDLE